MRCTQDGAAEGEQHEWHASVIVTDISAVAAPSSAHLACQCLDVTASCRGLESFTIMVECYAASEHPCPHFTASLTGGSFVFEHPWLPDSPVVSCSWCLAAMQEAPAA